MKNLLSWTLQRSVPQALGEAPLPRMSRRLARPDALGPGHSDTRTRGDGTGLLEPLPGRLERRLTDLEEQKLAEAAPIVRKVIDETLADLNEGLIGISWLHQSKGKEVEALQPHPRNISNSHAAEQLNGILQKLHTELRTWSGHETDVEQVQREAADISARAARMGEQPTKRRGRASAADDVDEDAAIEKEISDALRQATQHSNDARAWSLEDTDEATRTQLALADGVMSTTAALDDAVQAHAQGDARMHALQGTETDERVGDMEFYVDSMQARLHTLSQLDTTARSYLTQVSTWASQALRDRTTAEKAGEGRAMEERSALAGAEEERLDALLAGIRDAGDDGAGEATDTTAAAAADTRGVLRALAARRTR
ncbi:hypothetical protein MSPP1_002644 [Malassezia sp. CBS 17886]|nr:hypothetical protein MSPP1_002644 [Malassezia sp. CBS 17886]